MKPGVETVEGTVKSVVGPVYDKFHDVPIELLKFVDRKVLLFFNLNLIQFPASKFYIGFFPFLIDLEVVACCLWSSFCSFNCGGLGFMHALCLGQVYAICYFIG